MRKSVCLSLVSSIAVILAAMCLCRPVAAQDAPPDPDKLVRATLIANRASIEPGKPFKAGVDLVMEPGWHTYYRESGEAGMPTKIQWQLPPGFQAGPLEWPQPEKFVDSGIVTYGYKDRTLIGATITPPGTLKQAQRVTIAASVKWLACKEVCIPGKAELSLVLPVSAVGIEPPAQNVDVFSRLGFEGIPGRSILEQDLNVSTGEEKPSGLLAYLALAFVGGLILNFMPCVLPVISLKVLSFVQQAGEEPKRIFQLGLTFSAGIILSFLALAALVIAIQQAGQKVGWGFQFQYPAFVIGMCVVVLLLALSLFGLFYVSVPTGGSEIDKLARGEGYAGTFFKGVLATVLATPCTAPFLGTALGFAFVQPWWVVLAIFFSIGVGMAFPYLLLTARPGWMRFIPRPGVWMETFKESMGFVLLATVIWLLWILSKQVGVDGTIWTTAFLLAIAFAAWLVSRLTNLNSSRQRRYSVWALVLIVVGLAYQLCLSNVFKYNPDTEKLGGAQALPVEATEGKEIVWQPLTISKLDETLSQGKTVLIDFTAEWCLTCKVNEETVINTKPVLDKMTALNVVAFKADWTRQNPTITKLLQKFGRSGVPLYVIFPAGRSTEPIVLPEVITQSLLLEKLEEAGPSRV